jgi:hypothetical protein
MANDTGKNIALAILGIVAVLAVVGLVLLFTQSKTGMVARSDLYWSPTYGAFTNVADFKYMPDAATGGPYYLRNRWAMGNEPGGPRWRSEAGADVIGQYPEARYGGPLPGGNPYLEE